MAAIETVPTQGTSLSLAARFQAVRAMTAALAAPLSPEDQMVQSCAEASPVKWHLAHSSWFFETFVLREFLPGYRAYDPDFFWLFNSYYKSLGGYPEKRLRASFSRPSLARVQAYRLHIEEAILEFLEKNTSAEGCKRIELGMHHEQQHQELIATDIKHALWSNPLQPAYLSDSSRVTADPSDTSDATPRPPWIEYAGGLVDVGHDGLGFSFDNECGRHSIYLAPFRIASSLVTCDQYLEFIGDGGYRRAELWLSDGWDAIESENWRAPLYWHLDEDAEATVFTLRGVVPLRALGSSPVCHLSYYEADAYARWAGCRLPTEFEWEHVASTARVAGNFIESGLLHPSAGSRGEELPAQLFGDVWQWTQSAYLAYPGYKPVGGALGEYNGKFMCNQMVLRGGSIATPASHMRATYRNFFSPATRWQFSGLRLASDGASA